MGDLTLAAWLFPVRWFRAIIADHWRGWKMEKTAKPGLALAAIAPAVMVPILLPALTRMGVPDAAKGIIIGVLLGTSLLLIALAARNLHAARSASGEASMEPDAIGKDA